MACRLMMLGRLWLATAACDSSAGVAIRLACVTQQISRSAAAASGQCVGWSGDIWGAATHLLASSRSAGHRLWSYSLWQPASLPALQAYLSVGCFAARPHSPFKPILLRNPGRSASKTLLKCTRAARKKERPSDPSCQAGRSLVSPGSFLRMCPARSFESCLMLRSRWRPARLGGDERV